MARRINAEGVLCFIIYKNIETIVSSSKTQIFGQKIDEPNRPQHEKDVKALPLLDFCGFKLFSIKTINRVMCLMKPKTPTNSENFPIAIMKE